MGSRLADYRRQLGTSAVAALVVLRLVIGWHFFSEGLDKLAYDPATGGYRVAFSAAGFLSQAKGPLAGLFHSQVSEHGWQELLAAPRQNRPLTEEESAAQAQWAADYARRRAAAQKASQPVPIEFPPHAPYAEWASRIAVDWRAVLNTVTNSVGLTEEQRRQAAEAFVLRHQQLADYLAAESDAIAEYRHQLWRLEQWLAAPEARGVPFQQERIAAKQAETAAMARTWVDQVDQFEQEFLVTLRQILTPEQQADAAMTAAMDSALTSPQQARLRWINLAATGLTLGVGACLLLGLFTRTAAVLGALFLMAVIATQPPWIPGTESTIYQTIELVALLVVAATAAGRWFGLDYITYALVGRRHDAADK